MVEERVLLLIKENAPQAPCLPPGERWLARKGETDEENIQIIREAIADDTPVVLTPDYREDQDY